MRRALAAMWLIACGPAAAPRAKGPAAGQTRAEPAPAAEDRAAAPSPAVTIPEIEARVILAEMFRAAGYRILYDVPLALGTTTVAIDGFDPDKKVGFEYRAAAEASAWSGDLPAAAGVDLLVIDATDRDTVETRARAFLASVAPKTTE